jgi:hypothetical protein
MIKKVGAKGSTADQDSFLKKEEDKTIGAGKAN